MPTPEDRITALEKWMKLTDPRLLRALSIANALEGRPADATISIPHNDSLWFADNIDGSHGANLYYLIPTNAQRVVSARLSMKMLPYRTYSNFSVTGTSSDATGESGHSHSHSHGSAAHTHTVPVADNVTQSVLVSFATGAFSAPMGTGNATTPTNSTTPGNTGGDPTGSSGHSHNHSHTVSGSSFLGVSEGVTATGVTISFDGVDKTVALGGPFNVDQVEINVRPYLATKQGVWHLIAMQPSGLGRINAHLRLGYYATAGTGGF